MNAGLKKLYYESQHKIIMPEENGEHNLQLAATVAANFASIGFPMPNGLVTELSHASREDIVDFYQDNFAMLSEVIGADRHSTPFYPNFPESCMNKTDAEYYIDQVIYGVSGLEIEPALYMREKERFPFIGTPMYHTLQTGAEKEYYQSIQKMITSPVAYSKLQRDTIHAYLEEDSRRVKDLPDVSQIPNRENRVALASMAMETAGDKSKLNEYLVSANDVMRYAAVLSAYRDYERGAGKIVELQGDRFHQEVPKGLQKRDFYQYASLRFDKQHSPSFALSRSDRRTIMHLLEKAARGHGEKMAEEMLQHKDEWKKLIKGLHISDYPKCKQARKAFEIVSTVRGLDRPSRRIEEALKQKDLLAALEEAKKRPGDFSRRFDKFLRLGIEQGNVQPVMDALKEVAPKAGIGAALGLAGNIAKRDKEEHYRVFKAPSNERVVLIKEKNRQPIPEYYRNMVNSICQESLVERFKGKEPMGAVYVCQSLERVKVPVDIRHQSGGLSSITSGSTVPLPENNLERFFITWTNIEGQRDRYDGGRVDIDLSVAACGKDGKIVQFIGWNGEKNDSRRGYCFSGDVQDGGPANGEGRAEYIDIDRKKMLDHGIRYIIPSVNSYTGQLFSMQPHTAFGIMSLNQEDFGKVFEPQAVMNRFILDSPCEQFTPMVLDLEKNEIMWLNARAQEKVASDNLENILNGATYERESKTLPLYPIVMANVEANGKIAAPTQADILFVSGMDEVEALKEQYPYIDWDAKTVIESSN